MKSKKIRSRIHEFIPDDLMTSLDKICNNVVVTDNNIKAMTIKQTLDDYGFHYNELGPGTNRLAILVDGYVFKIAMDKWGKQDNANEFAMSKELQPFVIKVYESNDLISVSEYVTLISREEFKDKKNEIIKVLSILSESYLLGDVGYVEKNFTNWGYRDNDELVILDFAYIHNIHGEELFCPNDQNMLEYDVNFHFLRCPSCSKKFTFSDVRRKISFEEEWSYINDVKNHSYQLTSPQIIIKQDGEQDNKKIIKEETKMKDQEYTDDIIEEGYKGALQRLRENVKQNGEIVSHCEEKDVTLPDDTLEDNSLLDGEVDEEPGFGSALDVMRNHNNIQFENNGYPESDDYPDNDQDGVDEEDEVAEMPQEPYYAAEQEVRIPIKDVISYGTDGDKGLILFEEEDGIGLPNANGKNLPSIELDESEGFERPVPTERKDIPDVNEGISNQMEPPTETECNQPPTFGEDDNSGEIDYAAIADSVDGSTEGFVIERSTPVTNVSIATGNSKVDSIQVIAADNKVATVIELSDDNDTEEPTEYELAIELIDSADTSGTIVVEAKEEPKSVMFKVSTPGNPELTTPQAQQRDLLAEAYKQQQSVFKVTHPDVQVEESDDAKYRRLAEEHGYTEE